MAYVSTDHHAPSLPHLGAIRGRLFAARESFREWRRKRAVYLRTLRELQSYHPHELVDLRIQSGDFEELARKQAGF